MENIAASHDSDGQSATALLERSKVMDEVLPGFTSFEQSDSSTKSPASSENKSLALAESASGSQNLAAVKSLPGLEIVLGASGAQAPAHAGFLQAIEDKNVPVSKITGVSGGSLVAALYANHYSPQQIKDILTSPQFRYPSPLVMAQCFHLADPWNLYPYSIDFRPWIKDFVDTYNLRPQPNLRIVAADKETLTPVVFEGTNYDLVTALTASTAATIGMNMKPVDYQGRKLIDGFYYHPIPAQLSQAPAIVSKVGFVNKLPKQFLTPWDSFMHLREMAYYDVFTKKFPDPPGHLIAKTGLDDVATTTFGLTKQTMERLVKNGYESTIERLSQADAVKAIEEARKKSS